MGTSLPQQPLFQNSPFLFSLLVLMKVEETQTLQLRHPGLAAQGSSPNQRNADNRGASVSVPPPPAQGGWTPTPAFCREQSSLEITSGKGEMEKNPFHPPMAGAPTLPVRQELWTGLGKGLGRDLVAHPSPRLGLKAGSVLGDLQVLELQACKQTWALWIKALSFALDSSAAEDNTPVPL